MDVMARALALFLSLCSGLAGAAPNEIKVFTDELAAYHAYTLETHVNKAHSGPLRVMPEYSYGIWHDWEFSLQLPVAFGSHATNSEGYRAELQYVAPHDEEWGFYWGLNVELGQEHRASATPAAKLAYRAYGRNDFGLEYYVAEQSRMLYLAWDGKIGKSDINVGVGRGAMPAADRWVIKAIYEVAL